MKGSIGWKSEGMKQTDANWTKQLKIFFSFLCVFFSFHCMMKNDTKHYVMCFLSVFHNSLI
jgi:hypothetical protein